METFYRTHSYLVEHKMCIRDRAKADKARAQLKKDEAQAQKAKRDLERIRPLYEQNALDF